MEGLDDPARLKEIEDRIGQKQSLRSLYREIYERFADCLDRCPDEGKILELGSGGGFIKEIIPDVVTSDVIEYDTVDEVVDATRMPFDDSSLRAIFLLNVFHHIPDVGAFLAEASRTLVPGGRVLIVDQFPGLFSKPIYQYVHHEPFDDTVDSWTFASSGPLSDANGALAWIVFQRDRKQFEERYPELDLVRFEPHTPFRYWLAGGLKSWTLLPNSVFPFATAVDKMLIKVSPRLASFVDIELVRR